MLVIISIPGMAIEVLLSCILYFEVLKTPKTQKTAAKNRKKYGFRITPLEKVGSQKNVERCCFTFFEKDAKVPSSGGAATSKNGNLNLSYSLNRLKASGVGPGWGGKG